MPAKPRAIPSTIKTSLDLSLVVFDGDRDMRDALLKDKDFKEAVDEQSTSPSLSIRRDLLLTSVRLTPRIAPELFASVEHCTKALGIEYEVEVYCSQDASMNAFVVPPQGSRICIGFSNIALERFDDAELRFVLGHELGHTLFGHYLLSLPEGDIRVSSLNVMRYYAWKRYAELTCDRVGLICCQDYNAAMKTFFKLTSGLSEPKWLANVTEQAMHYAVQETSAMEEKGDAVDWYSTHPYSPLRVKALDLFNRSKTYHKLIGKEGGELSEAALEKEVSGLVELMNPSVLSEKVACKSEMNEMIAVTGIAIARADNEIHKKEIKAIKSLLPSNSKMLAQLDDIKKMSEDDIITRVNELAAVLNLKLPGIRRLKLVEDICSVALADGAVKEEEKFVLYGVADRLGVTESFVDEVLCRAGKGLD